MKYAYKIYILWLEKKVHIFKKGERMKSKRKSEIGIFLTVISICLIVSFAMGVKVEAASYDAWTSVFDPVYYASHNAEAAAYAKGNNELLWQYFLTVGILRGDQASEEFNVFIYAKNYPQLYQAYGGNIKQYYVHYATQGKAAGLNAKSLNAQDAQNQTDNNNSSGYSFTPSKALPATYKCTFLSHYGISRVEITNLSYHMEDGKLYLDYTYNNLDRCIVSIKVFVYDSNHKRVAYGIFTTKMNQTQLKQELPDLAPGAYIVEFADY